MSPPLSPAGFLVSNVNSKSERQSHSGAQLRGAIDKRSAICDVLLMGTVEQFLTAVFELRPSRRKAALMERARASAEKVFWEVIADGRQRADAVVDAPRVDQRKTIAAFEAEALRLANAARLPEPIRNGLARDVGAGVKSYIGLRSSGHEAQWPARFDDKPDTYEIALDAFRLATTKDEVDAARNEFSRVVRGPTPRPMTIARFRDVMILRERTNGPLVVVLNILNATDRGARKTEIKAGLNAATGAVVPKITSATRVVVPLSCSSWHENKFLSGRAELRSSQLLRRGDRWFLAAQFAFKKEVIKPIAALGIDRGMVNLVTAAAVDFEGAVRAALPVCGNEVAQSIRDSERRSRAYQRRTGRSVPLHKRSAHHLLHAVANEIVAEAKARQAQIVIEKLDGLKSTITTKRPKGARRSSWQKHLKRAQLGKLEAMLNYKAALAGLPPPRSVLAAGTSTTCSRCGHRESKNRPAQDRFLCVACGFENHADANAAVQIARRGVMKITKGDKLDALHLNMVTLLRQRDDGGLGPLAAGVAKGFVAARASADGANEEPSSLTSLAGQNVTLDDKNVQPDVFAERVVAISGAADEESGRPNSWASNGRGNSSNAV